MEIWNFQRKENPMMFQLELHGRIWKSQIETLTSATEKSCPCTTPWISNKTWLWIFIYFIKIQEARTITYLMTAAYTVPEHERI